MTPGIYPGMPMAEYLALPAIGSGVICTTVERCTAAAWYISHLNPHRQIDDPSKESDAGTLAHALVLEGNDELVWVIDPADYPGKRGGIPDGWTNDAIRAARDDARGAGRIPVLRNQWARIKAMADSARAFIDSLRNDEPAVWRAFQDGGGDSELTAVWDDHGVLCRMRHDRINTDRALDVNLKFVSRSAHPDGFARSGLMGMGYATGAAWYRRGMRAAYGVDDPVTAFIVVEQEPPYLCSHVGLDPSWIAYGDMRVKWGMAQWRGCIARNRWDGYPTRAAYPEMPGYLLAQMEEQEIEQPFGSPLDYAKLTQQEHTA